MGLRADSQLENTSVVLFGQHGSVQASASTGSVWYRGKEVQCRPRHQVTTDQCQTEALRADNLII